MLLCPVTWGYSSVPAHPSGIQGCSQDCVTHACFLGAVPCMGPVDSEAHIHTIWWDVAILSLGSFSLPDGRGEPAVPGAALVAWCNRSLKINNHCDCTPSPTGIYSSQSPALKCCSNLVGLTLGVEVMWQSSLLKLLPFGRPETYYCLPNRLCVYMFFSACDW
jgi:hypothetical protein